ncbi:MAG: hypothetical protein Tsb0034_22850 [Ekhidna sp.]
MEFLVIKGWEYLEGAAYIVTLQLLILAILNLYTKRNQNVFLALILLLFVDGIRNSFIYYHLDNSFLQSFIGNLHINYFFGPLIYLYLVSLVTQELKKRQVIKHLIAPIALIIIIQTIGLLVYWEIIPYRRNILLYDTKLLLLVIYFFFGLALIRNKNKWNNIRQASRFSTFFWIVNLYLIQSGVMLLLSKYYIISVGGFISYLSISLFLGVNIYLIYYSLTELNWIKNKFIKSKTLISTNGNHEVFDQLSKNLQSLIEEEKIHVNPDLSMKMLANKLNTTTANVSDYLNVRLKKNFYDFINEVRVEEFKKNLKSGNYGHLDLVGIAYASGFSSKATFNRAFKKIEGMTPKEFRSKEVFRESA